MRRGNPASNWRNFACPIRKSPRRRRSPRAPSPRPRIGCPRLPTSTNSFRPFAALRPWPRLPPIRISRSKSGCPQAAGTANSAARETVASPAKLTIARSANRFRRATPLRRPTPAAPQHAYFASCSNGGRQALMEAQRFPEDYDGILAGAPANYWTHLLTSALWNAQVTTLDPASYIPTSKIPALAHAVNEACDAPDGVKDGVLNDPRKCHFKPATLLCKEGDSDSCLTQPQVTALEKLYEGARDSIGRQVFPGFMPGGEEGGGGWPLWITGPGPGQSLLFAFGNGYFSDMVYNDANWSYKTAKLDDAVVASDKKFASVLNATDPDMKAFASHGGKLIIYHGWNDAAISALNSIDYYESVRKTMGPAQTDAFLRLYLVPGMQHCSGGPGTDTFGQFGFSPQ